MEDISFDNISSHLYIHKRSFSIKNLKLEKRNEADFKSHIKVTHSNDDG